jgi:hypothetical protein
VNDPTVAAMEARNAEHERLRAEVVRLTKVADAMFAKGYDLAVSEIRDHFKKTKQQAVAAEIESIWIKGSPEGAAE